MARTTAIRPKFEVVGGAAGRSLTGAISSRTGDGRVVQIGLGGCWTDAGCGRGWVGAGSVDHGYGDGAADTGAEAHAVGCPG
jgi:hypothetical protein